jgi:hypothetical protein
MYRPGNHKRRTAKRGRASAWPRERERGLLSANPISAIGPIATRPGGRTIDCRQRDGASYLAERHIIARLEAENAKLKRFASQVMLEIEALRVC